MTQFIWKNSAGGDFANGANWNQSGAVPGPNDDALLTSVGTYTVTSNQNETVNSLQMISTVTFDITGGTFQMTNGSGSGTDNGLIAINGNNTLVLGGTLAGSGVVQINSNGFNDTLLLNSGTTTLSGGGSIITSDSGANLIFAATAGNILNNVNDTISGGGRVGLDQTGLNNQSGGVIDGTGTVSTMILDFGTYSALNAGLIEATGPAGLQIQNSTINNTGGTLKAAGANVALSLVNTTINGGTLLTSGGGAIQTYGGNTAGLSGVTIAAGTTFAINQSSTLDISAAIVNKGTIALNTDGYNDVLEVISATATLSGGGTVSLSDNGSNLIYGSVSTNKLINVNNKILGSGQIGSNSMVFDNQAAGVIDATGTYAALRISAGPSTNEGLIEATNTAGLFIQGTTITNTGTILAAGIGSAVNVLNGSDIVGGKLATATGGIIQDINYGTLDGSTKTGAITITAASTVEINNSSTLYALGSFVNGGTILMQSDGYNNDLIIDAATVTMSGGGKLALSDVYGNRIFGAAGGDNLINVNNTISGSGQLGVGQLSLDNQAAGVIDSTGLAGMTLQLTAFTNEGLVEDTGAGGLGLRNTTLVNNATLAASGAGATFDIYDSSAVEGGSLVSSSGGFFETTNTGTLDGATNGALTLTAGSIFNINGSTTLDLAGSIVNDGTFAMNSNGYNNDFVVNGATVTLTGGGQILMNDHSGNRIYGASSNNLLINVNNTISGSGQIGAAQGSFDNQSAGVIDATGTNAGITIFAQSFTNEGLIEDTGIGGVGIQSTTIVNSGTLLSSGAGSTVNFYNGATIEGGTLVSTAGGVFETTNGATLDGATNGSLTLTSGSILDLNNSVTLDLAGTIVNHGTLAMNSDGYNNDLVANSSTVTLTGGGAIEMNDNGGNRLYGGNSGDTFVNVNNVISGSGQIGANQGTIDNQAAGIIDATGGVGITLAATAFSNEGLIEATNTGGVTTGNTSVVNTGTIAANGAGDNVNVINGAAIEGGVLAASGGGFIETTNYGTLDGATHGAITITSAASVELNNSVTLYVGGSIVNQGSIALSSNGYNNDLVLNTATVSLSGGGQLVMSDRSSNRVYGTSAADKLVNVNNTISGSGQLGSGQMTIDNQKIGTIDATGTGANLTINTNSIFTNEGLVEATGPAGLLIQNTTLTNTGIIAALSGSSVNINNSNSLTNYNAGTLTSGVWESSAATGATSSLTIAAGTITTDAAHLILSGAGANIIAGGTSVLTTVNTISSKGELDIVGGATYTTANLTNSGILEAGSAGVINLTGGTFTNIGSVTVIAGGTINVAEKDKSFSAGALNRGSWNASGAGAKLILAAGVVTTDSSSITLSGAGSKIVSGSASKTLESTLTTISAGAQFNVLAARGFASTVTSGLTDNGSLSLGGGTFSDVSLAIASGGTFSGGGTLVGAVTDNGVLGSSASPTGSNGALMITGAISGAGALTLNNSTQLTASAGFAVGTVSIGSGALLTGAGSTSGAVTDSGTLALGATGTLAAASLSVAAGALVMGSALSVSGAVSDSGTITLSGGTSSAGSLTLTGGVLNGFGTVTTAVANSGTIIASGGTLNLAAAETGGALQVAAGGALSASSIQAASLTIAAGGAFSGAGAVSGNTVDSGTLTASAGTLTLATTNGAGSALIASGAKLVSTSALTLGGGVSFTAGGSGETLALGVPNGNTAIISNFGAGDTIDLLNATATTFTYNATSGVLTLKNGSTAIGQVKFAGSYSKTSFQLASDGVGGTEILFTGAAQPNALTDLKQAIQQVGPAMPQVATPPSAQPAVPELGGGWLGETQASIFTDALLPMGTHLQ